jgi:hypothetical protein
VICRGFLSLSRFLVFAEHTIDTPKHRQNPAFSAFSGGFLYSPWGYFYVGVVGTKPRQITPKPDISRSFWTLGFCDKSRRYLFSLHH